MKFHKSSFIILLVLGYASYFVACNKEEERMIDENLDLSGKGIIKIYNATLGSTRNNIYIDNIPITGTTGTYAFSSAFPSTVYGIAVEPGNRAIQIKDTQTTSTQKPIDLMASIAAGKNYTIFTYDTLTQAKAKIVETAIVTSDSSRLRFANFIFSTTPVPNVDVYSVKRQENIFTNVATTQVTDYIPFSSFRNDTLYVRATGTTANLTPVFGFSPTRERSYTIVFTGRYQTTGATGIARLLTSFPDY